VKVEVGSNAALPAGTGLARDGYLFIGWATDRNATEAITSLQITSTKDTILYAVWAPLSVSLKAKAGSETVIDDENGFIYGLAIEVSEADMIADYLAVDGNGTIRVQQASYVGTGLEVQLINNYTGNVDATYKIVIFGDVDGDGTVTTDDIRAIKGHVTGAAEFGVGSAQELAADVDGDGVVTMQDATMIKGMISGAVELNQATRRAE